MHRHMCTHGVCCTLQPCYTDAVLVLFPSGVVLSEHWISSGGHVFNALQYMVFILQPARPLYYVYNVLWNHRRAAGTTCD